MAGQRDDASGPEGGAQRVVHIDLREGGVHDLTPVVWGSFAEAASVMLDRYHAPPPPPCACAIHAADGGERPGEITWVPASEAMRASHANRHDATEWGAYAVAAMTVHALLGWRVVARAHHGSGADFLMMADDDPDAFIRLEVSGIAECSDGTWGGVVMARLRKKVDQLGRGDLEYPGVAAVVGFQVVHIAVSRVVEP